MYTILWRTGEGVGREIIVQCNGFEIRQNWV